MASNLPAVTPAEQLNALIAQLAQLNQTLQAQFGLLGNLPQPQPLQQVVSLPVSPATLVQSVFATQVPGVAAPQFLSFPTAVPAGGSATVSYTVPVGYALMFVGPFTLDSTLYDAALTATLVVDNENVLYQDFPIDHAYSQQLPQYGVVRRNMVATFINATTQNALVTPSAEAVLLANNIYDGVILPLLKVAYTRIESFAENAFGQGAVS